MFSGGDGMLSPKQLKTRLDALGVTAGDHLLIAVSGGADSLALLDLCVRLRATYPLTVSAVHVNHALRPESAREADAVRAYCETVAVPLEIVTWPVSDHPATGIEAAARRFRYATFAAVASRVGATAVLTAHHQDDQAETVLFRLLRSGAAASAAGIAARSTRAGVTYLRPLLGVPRAELRAYAAQRALPVQEDASNADTQYSRNFLRHRVLPVIRSRFPRGAEHLARFAVEQQGMLALAAQATTQALTQLGDDPQVIDLGRITVQDAAARRLILQAALARVVPDVTAKQVAMVWQAVTAADGETRTVTLGGGWRASVHSGQIKLGRGPIAQALPPPTVTLELGERTVLPEGTYALQADVPAGWQRLAAVPEATVTLRGRMAGDWVLLHHDVRQKLRRFFINQQVPQSQRASLRLACTGARVWWLADSDLTHLLKPESTDKIKANLIFKPTTER